jgi:hypothetical protein
LKIIKKSCRDKFINIYNFTIGLKPDAIDSIGLKPDAIDSIGLKPDAILGKLLRSFMSVTVG